MAPVAPGRAGVQQLRPLLQDARHRPPADHEEGDHSPAEAEDEAGGGGRAGGDGHGYGHGDGRRGGQEGGGGGGGDHWNDKTGREGESGTGRKR